MYYWEVWKIFKKWKGLSRSPYPTKFQFVSDYPLKKEKTSCTWHYAHVNKDSRDHIKIPGQNPLEIQYTKRFLSIVISRGLIHGRKREREKKNLSFILRPSYYVFRYNVIYAFILMVAVGVHFMISRKQKASDHFFPE